MDSENLMLVKLKLQRVSRIFYQRQPKATMTCPVKIAALLMAALLVACATVQLRPYEPPTSGSFARLSVKTLVAMPFTVVAYRDAEACTGPQSIAASASSAAAVAPAAPIVIPANLLSTVGVSMGRSTSCQVLISFLPQANHHYQLTAQQGDGRCSLAVDDITDGQRHPQAVEKRARSFVGCVPRPGLVQLLATQAPSGKPTLDDFKNILPKN